MVSIAFLILILFFTAILFKVMRMGEHYPYLEGFVPGDPRLNVSNSMFSAVVPPSGAEENSELSPGGANDPLTEKIISSAALPAMSLSEVESNWGKMTSQRCYKTDIGESLKLTRNYLQRTNNYIREHPDDCSAPNHEFLGTFYNPFDGVGRTPACGTDYPPSTQCA